MAIFSRRFIPIVRNLRNYYGKARIGNRDVVGHGCNGIYAYKDDAHFPFPAIRFRENSAYYFTVFQALRIKEKGDWNLLTIEEKKTLYRVSFCQTFAEFQYYTGSWMFCVGWALIFVGCGCWIMMFSHCYVFDERPASLKPENRAAQLRRMLDLHVNPIDGLSSKWNYEQDGWTSESATILPGHDEMGEIVDPLRSLVAEPSFSEPPKCD